MSNVKIKEIKNKIKKIPYAKEIYRKLVPERSYSLREEKKLIEQAPKIFIDWPNNIKKPRVGLVKERGDKITEGLYWPKYERFLINNNIPYDFLDIHNSRFIQEAEKFDMIIWRTLSDPATQREAETKIKILEKIMGKLCFPSETELWFYEDKIRQYYLLSMKDLPVIDTFITYSKEEALEYIKRCEYPIVSKISTGSGSLGVKLIKDEKKARKICKKIFDEGLDTYWPFKKQKNYVYFQDFIEGASFDLRIIIIGNSYFGYYRKVPKGDFRASGNAKYEKKDIPEEALLLAKKVKESLPDTRMLAVDLLKNPKDDKYYIIETSIFIGVDTPEQLVIDDIAGRYVYENGEFRFDEGKFWIQELTLIEVLKDWKGMESNYKTS